MPKGELSIKVEVKDSAARSLWMAVGSLLDVCDHMTKHPHSGCDNPQPNPDNWDEGVAACGGCWPCLLSQLEQRVGDVRDFAQKLEATERVMQQASVPFGDS